MILWAPVTNSKSNPEDHYGPEALKELEENRTITRLKEQAPRQKVIIGKEFIDHWKNINQKDLFAKVQCPTLIVHGNQDDRVPLEDSQRALEVLPKSSQLQVIEGADHIFNSHIDEFINYSLKWLEENFPK